jgi:hypothetical protein
MSCEPTQEKWKSFMKIGRRLLKMEVGDLVRVVAESKSYDIPCKVVAHGILLADQAEEYFEIPAGWRNHISYPYEILLTDGTIFRDWANIWRLELWSDDESR